MKTSGISILVVDDYQPWRDYACSILPQWLKSPLITEARDGLEAIHKAEELQPDLILLDVGLPEVNGLEAAQCIRETSPRSKILFVSEDRSPEIVTEGLHTGAGGYITKSSAARELWPAIQAVLRGDLFLGEGISVLPNEHSDQSSSAPTPLSEEFAEGTHSHVGLRIPDENPAQPARLTKFLRVFTQFPIAGWATLVVFSGIFGFLAGNLTPRFSTPIPQATLVASKPLSSKPVASRRATGQAHRANSLNAKKLTLLQAHKRHLQQLLAADEKQITALQKKRSRKVKSIANSEITAEHYEKALLSALAELRSLKEAGASRDAELVATRYRLNELERDLAEQRSLPNQGFASTNGRSIAVPSAAELRNLIGARNLHVADVSDVNTTENQPKPFGRVFYTRGKSLVLFAYDLSKTKPNQTFYAWGSRQSDPHRPQSLGALRADDQAQKRWILQFNDPKVLAGIDSVYVTLEPTNTPGDLPNGRKVLSAYLGPSPKYP